MRISRNNLYVGLFDDNYFKNKTAKNIDVPKIIKTTKAKTNKNEEFLTIIRIRIKTRREKKISFYLSNTKTKF